MPLTADRVQEESTTTGTGTLNLAGAVQGHDTFVAGIGNGNTCFYAIYHTTAGEWEVGIGTVTDASPDTLSRTTVISSSNSDAAVNFSAGTKRVCATLPARLLAQHVRAVDASETLADTDYVILAANTAARTLTLPAASGRAGKEYVIVKTSKNSLGVTIDANASETINSLTTWPLYHCLDVLRIKCDGSNWQVVGEAPQQKRITTTDATETTLWALTLEQNTQYLIEATVLQARTGGTSGTAGDGHVQIVHGMWRRVGAGAAEFVSNGATVNLGDGLSQVVMDASSNDARVRVIGSVDTNYTHYARVRILSAVRYSD